MKKLNNKGFTLIELLAVAVILAVLSGIAIPIMSRITQESKKEAYLDIVRLQTKSIEQLINSNEYYVYDTEKVYYFDYRLGNEEQATESPYGEWRGAYVVVTYDGKRNNFYWTGIDSAGWKIDLKKKVDSLKPIDIYNSNSKKVIPGATIGGRDFVTIYTFDENTKKDVTIEQGVSNQVTYEEAIQCYTLQEVPETDPKLDSPAYAITGYNKDCGSEVNVPSSIDGHRVRLIEENAFMNKGLTKVTLYYGIEEIRYRGFQGNSINELKLPSSLTKIGDYAFQSNKLTELDLPEGLKSIGSYGFANNLLTEVIFPKSLTSIGSYAFYGNKLKNAEFHSNPSIGGGAFAQNVMPPSKGIIYKYDSVNKRTDYTTIVGYGGSSKDVVIPEMINGIAPTTIASSAFASNGLKSVVIPDSVTKIDSSAFYSNSLTSIKLPANLQYIGGSAFRENLLSSVDIPPSVTTIKAGAFVRNCFPAGEDIIYARNSDGSTDYSIIVSGAGGKSSGSTCKGNLDLVIPAEKNGVKLKKIEGSAFTCCYYKTVSFPELSDTNKLTIGTNAFYHNSFTGDNGWIYQISNGVVDYSVLSSYGGLRSGTLVIPGEKNGVELKTINASFTWTSFTSIEIPSSVTTIAGGIFSKSTSNNKSLVKIINKTGKAFDWYSLTGSTHTKPNPAKFVTGTVSHQSGDIEITDH